MLVEAIAICCTFAAGFWAGSKFRTWGALKESLKGWWVK